MAMLGDDGEKGSNQVRTVWGGLFLFYSARESQRNDWTFRWFFEEGEYPSAHNRQAPRES